MNDTPDLTWPKMAEMEFDEDGLSVDGTDPISIVSLGGYGTHNEPHPSVDSAACAYCNRWAVSFFVGVNPTVDGLPSKRIHRRMELTLIYACDQHLDDAGNELLDTYGSCGNSLSSEIELALQVEKGFSR